MTYLSTSTSTTDLSNLIKRAAKKEIADFLHERFSERYLKPVINSSNKHGFTLMAIACLTIESFESVKNGWPNTKNTSKKAFKSFFASEARFFEFKEHSEQFYVNVRCGILHQSETTNGWRISRKGDLFNKDTRTLNATKFVQELQHTIAEFSSNLAHLEWNSNQWKNVVKKLNAIIENCNHNN